MVLHPIATALAFTAAFVAIAAGSMDSLTASILAALASIFAAIAMGIDLTVLKIIEKRSNDLRKYADFTVLGRHYGPVMYCLMGAPIFLTAVVPLILYTVLATRRAEIVVAAPAEFHSLGSADSVAMAGEKEIEYRPW